MTDKAKSQLATIIIASLAALVGGGGGSVFVNANVIERLTRVETEVINIKADKANIEKERDELQNDIDKILIKIESNQIFMRDVLLEGITDLKVEVSALKARNR